MCTVKSAKLGKLCPHHMHFKICRVCSWPLPSQTSWPRTSFRGTEDRLLGGVDLGELGGEEDLKCFVIMYWRILNTSLIQLLLYRFNRLNVVWKVKPHWEKEWHFLFQIYILNQCVYLNPLCLCVFSVKQT